LFDAYYCFRYLGMTKTDGGPRRARTLVVGCVTLIYDRAHKKELCLDQRIVRVIKCFTAHGFYLDGERLVKVFHKQFLTHCRVVFW